MTAHAGVCAWDASQPAVAVTTRRLASSRPLSLLFPTTLLDDKVKHPAQSELHRRVRHAVCDPSRFIERHASRTLAVKALLD